MQWVLYIVKQNAQGSWDDNDSILKVINPTLIPRIGDSIHAVVPTTKVKNVLWDYDSNIIVVLI